MASRLAGTTQIRRVAVLAVALAAASGVAIYAGSGAGAAAAPTIGQVKAEVNSLQARVDKIGQLYDAAGQQAAAAKAQLAQASKATLSAQTRYNAARDGLTAVAVAAYENANQTSVLGLLSSSDPGAVLSQASLVMEVAGTHNAQAALFLSTAQNLAATRMQRQRTEEGVAQIKAQLAAEKSKLTKLLDSRQATLDSLNAAQQAQVEAATIGATQSTSTAPSSSATQTATAPPAYTGPNTTQADKAVAFAFAQLGKPYVWGATGPGAYDCSGLVQAAWAAAGVAIPRVTYEQWAALPHVPLAAIRPGDLLLYDGEGHVAMYVGNGMIIDAPRTGLSVQELPESTSWYAGSLDGVVRP